MADRMINVSGLREMQDDLNLLGDTLDRSLELATVDAADLVASEAKQRARRDSRTGRAMNSIKVIASPKGDGRVTAGGPGAEHYAWTDFGGSTKRHKGSKQRPMFRKFIPTGRYIYPAMKSLQDDIQDVLAERMNEGIEEAGFDGG